MTAPARSLPPLASATAHPMSAPTEDHDHLAVKGAEVEYLRECLELPRAAGPADFDQLLQEKRELRGACLRRFACDDPNMRETALTTTRQPLSTPSRYRWGYQRFDLEIDAPPPYPTLGGALAECSWDLSFTASGMSAISAVLHAIALDAPLTLYHRPDAYFETPALVRELLPGSSTRAVPEEPEDLGTISQPQSPALAGALIDSFGERSHQDLLGALSGIDLDFVLMDSTCYDVASPRLEHILTACVERAPTFVVRSHVKLDQLGMEFGRLGSVLLLLPSGLPPQRALRWMRGIRTIQCRYGTLPTVALLPPFLFDNARVELDTARAVRTAAVTGETAAALHARLDPQRFDVLRFHHGRFVGVSPRFSCTKQDVERWGRALATNAARRCGPMAHMNSFGFDWPTLDAIYDLRRAGLGERPVLRVGAGDLPPSVRRALVNDLVEAAAQWR